MSISYLNSLTPRNVVSGFVFTGVYDEILSTSQISVRITTKSSVNSYALFVYYSNDKVNVVSQELFTVIDTYNYINYLTPTSRYFKLRFELISDYLTDLSIETIFKTAIVYNPETAIVGSVSVNNFPATQAVSGTVEVIGQEPQPRFYATPATNTATVYADGAQGVNVNGGWLYVNTGGSNKINWYVYANTVDQASTAKKIKDIKNMYMVIYQKSTEVLEIKNPFIAFYSLMDAGTNNGTWYKNRYVFENNYEQASVVGTKLLYMGDDNPLIHPEITVRIKLDISTVNSTNTLAGGAEEDLWLSSIHTTSNAGAGEYNFVFSEFGIDFNEEALQPTVLPIIDNKVQVSGSVAITNTFIQTREQPTQTTFYRINNGSSDGVVLFNGPRVLRNLSITNTSSEIIYIHFYNMATIPTSGDSAIWLIPIAPNAMSNIMNQLDHSFTVGIAYRLTTTFNNDVSPTSFICFLNGTYGY